MQQPQVTSSSTASEAALPAMVTSGENSGANAGTDAATRGSGGESNENSSKGNTQSYKIFTDLRDYDVLLGRGNGVNNRAGNVNFRKLVESHRDLYTRARRIDKVSIAEKVVNMVRSNGGRFLRLLDIGTGADVSNSNPTLTGTGRYAHETYQEISHARAIEKSCQALREGCSGRKQQRAFVKAALALKNGSGRLKRGLGKKAENSNKNTNTNSIDASDNDASASTTNRNNAYKQITPRPVHPPSSAGRGYGAAHMAENIPTISTFGTGAAAYAAFAAAAAASSNYIHHNKTAMNSNNQSNQNNNNPMTSQNHNMSLGSQSMIHNDNNINQNPYNDLKRREFLESMALLSKAASTPWEQSQTPASTSLPTSSVTRMASTPPTASPSTWALPSSNFASSSSRLALLSSSALYQQSNPQKMPAENRYPDGTEIDGDNPVAGQGNTVTNFPSKSTNDKANNSLKKIKKIKHRLLQKSTSNSKSQSDSQGSQSEFPLAQTQPQSQIELQTQGKLSQSSEPQLTQLPSPSSTKAGERSGNPTPKLSSPDVPNDTATSASVNGYCCTPCWYDDDEWDDLYQQLLGFCKLFGHCAVPPLYDKNEKLADWACYQRQIYRETVQKGYRLATKLEKARIDRLQKVQFVWDYDDWHWEHQYQELCNMQQKHQSQQNVREENQEEETQNMHPKEATNSSKEFDTCLNLALWLKDQRGQYMDGLAGKEHTMVTDDRRQKLEKLFTDNSASSFASAPTKRANGSSTKVG